MISGGQQARQEGAPKTFWTPCLIHQTFRLEDTSHPHPLYRFHVSQEWEVLFVRHWNTAVDISVLLGHSYCRKIERWGSLMHVIICWFLQNPKLQKEFKTMQIIFFNVTCDFTSFNQIRAWGTIFLAPSHGKEEIVRLYLWLYVMTHEVICIHDISICFNQSVHEKSIYMLGLFRPDSLAIQPTIICGKDIICEECLETEPAKLSCRFCLRLGPTFLSKMTSCGLCNVLVRILMYRWKVIYCKTPGVWAPTP